MPRPRAALAALILALPLVVAAAPSPNRETAAPLVPKAWSPKGGQIDAKFGSSVAPAGDVNSDGFGDVLVGAPDWDGGADAEGHALLYYGTANGIAAVPAWNWESNQVGARAGACVAPAGDVNLDGYADVLVGAPSWDEPGLPNTGAVFVFYGSSNGLPLLPNVKLLNFFIESNFGTSAGTAGDVNADEYADVVVGAPMYSNGEFKEGACFVFHGSNAGLATVPARTLEGDFAGAHFGASVSAAGDVNADGFADIVVGAPDWSGGINPEGGRAYAYPGSAGGIGAVASWSAQGVRDSSHFGASVANAGDMNADGYADIVIGSPGADPSLSGFSTGAAHLYMGTAAFVLGAPFLTASGAVAGERMGISVATAGDVNADGYADFVCGGDRWSSPGGQKGRVLVFIGAKTSVAQAAELFGTVNGEAFGFSVATSGDANGDGFSELLVGSPEASPTLAREGRASVFEGGAADPIAPDAWPRTGPTPGNSYGESVAILPGIDTNDFASVAIGERFFSGAVNQSGRFMVHRGVWGGVNSQIAYSREGVGEEDMIGERMANSGDVDRDGFADLLVSSIAYSRDANHVDEGRVWLYRGSPSGPQLDPWLARGDQEGAQFGSVLSGAGDVNGDGYADVVIGAPYWDSPTLVDCGKAVVYFGGPAGLGAPSWIRNGTVAGQGLGSSVAMAGDLDGDGYSDVAVGSANGVLPVGSRKVEVFFGSPAGLPVSPEWTFLGTTASYGETLAGIGDFSGDGVSDLAIGAPVDNTFGAVFIHVGNHARAFPVQPQWTITGTQAQARFGSAIAGGGDVDGDGFADLVIGERAWTSGEDREGRLHLFRGGVTDARLVASWQVESNNPVDQLGNSISPLGDVDGDGFADIVAGVSGGANRAYIYLGGGIGVTRRATQAEPLAAGVGRWAPALTSTANGVGINLWFRTAAGRDQVTSEYEIVPQTSPFTGLPNQFYSYVDTQAPTPGYGSVTRASASLIVPWIATGYHWRARTVSRSPYFPRTRWMTADARLMGEYDFKTSGTNVAVDPTGTIGQGPRLARIDPNPSAGESRIAFWLPAPGRATIDVYDTRGRHIRRIAGGEWAGGLTVRAWDGKDGGGKRVAGGVYLVELRAGTDVDRAKVVRTR